MWDSQIYLQFVSDNHFWNVALLPFAFKQCLQIAFGKPQTKPKSMTVQMALLLHNTTWWWSLSVPSMSSLQAPQTVNNFLFAFNLLHQPLTSTTLSPTQNCAVLLERTKVVHKVMQNMNEWVIWTSQSLESYVSAVAMLKNTFVCFSFTAIDNQIDCQRHLELNWSEWVLQRNWF